MKCKYPHLGFELRSPIPFFMIINIALSELVFEDNVQLLAPCLKFRVILLLERLPITVKEVSLSYYFDYSW